jgi:DNA polymerase I-like protein with 3'-5' exonuclease and polymerase domains
LGFPVRTWGGRVYQPEAPRLVDGRLRRWDYKALNVVVQGGSADLTKAAMIEYAAVAGPAPMILTVHDEIVVTAPADEDEQAAAMARLRDAMNVDRLDVPMRSEGYVGPNWQDKTKLKDVTPPPPEPDRPDDGRYEHGDGKLGPQPPFPK